MFHDLSSASVRMRCEMCQNPQNKKKILARIGELSHRMFIDYWPLPVKWFGQ